MFERFRNFIKSHYQSILIFISILLIISPVILSRQLNDLDEIWNYNFAKNIADGLIPYKDFNMLQTPLLPFINGLLLKVFGNELFTMRILATFLISSIFFMFYKILKKLNVNIFYNLICIFLLFLLLKDYICIDYNFSILFLILILIYLELNYYLKNNIPKNSLENNEFKNNNLINDKIKNNTNKNNLIINKKQLKKSNYLFFNFLIGFICGCCILLKQSTGIFISLASVLYPILFIKNKINFKNYIKISFIKILGILIPIILLIIYLLINNALYDFIDYTILGIKTFTNSIPYNYLLNSSNLVIKILSIFTPIFIIFSGIYLWIKKEKKLYNIFFYSLASLIVIYPISDNIYFLIGIMPLFILFFYLLFEFLKLIINKLDKIIKNKNLIFMHNLITKIKLFFNAFLKIFIILIFIYIIILFNIFINNYFNNFELKHNINHYKNISISKGLLNKINIIDNYILSQNNNVYILDAEAAIHMIPINKYNKNYDMFLKGNLGSQGEIGQIELIKNLESGTKILIKNNKYSLNWQTPINVINYIRNNFNKIGEISIFDIYEIN